MLSGFQAHRTSSIFNFFNAKNKNNFINKKWHKRKEDTKIISHTALVHYESRTNKSQLVTFISIQFRFINRSLNHKEIKYPSPRSILFMQPYEEPMTQPLSSLEVQQTRNGEYKRLWRRASVFTCHQYQPCQWYLMFDRHSGKKLKALLIALKSQLIVQRFWQVEV